MINHRHQIISYLLTGFSKIFELLFFFELNHHLVSYNILANEQFDFHDNVSTDSAVSKLIRSIFSAWDNKEHITGPFCDLAKPFDSASYELLILKLECYAVKGCTLNWLKCYLHNRKQTAVLQFVISPNLLSDWEVAKQRSQGICFWSH